MIFCRILYFMLFATLLFPLFSPAAPQEKRNGNTAGIRIDFSESSKKGKSISGWHYRGKPFTKDVEFSIVTMDGVSVLRVLSRKSSGTILYDISSIDLEKYPVLRWKWKACRLPGGANALDPRKDDQVLAVYAGAGRPYTNCVAFRWETLTRKGMRGRSKYNMGLVSVSWFVMRDRRDQLNTWYVEEVNLLKHLRILFPKGIPKKDLALSITGNSQNTGTDSVGYIEYLEFLPAAEMKNGSPVNHQK